MTPFGRLSVWLALLAVSVLLPGQASANPPPENLVPVDQNGYFVNEHTDLFTKTGARVAKYKDANKDRLAVVYYAHRGWRMSGLADMGTPSVLHTRSLNCSLIMLQKNLAPWTPLDIIIVAPPETIERDGFPSWLSRWENLYLVAQPDPPPPDGVAEELAKNSYMRICSWRITHQFHLVKSLGYKYFLQHDDDAFEVIPFNHSVIEAMKAKKQVMGGYCRHCFQEFWGFSRGGAELMRFFLISKQISKPKGDLFSHCNPPNMSGLYTWQAFDGIDPGEQQGGWDRNQLAGNWNLFDIDFWFQEDVQDFIRLVLDSDQQYESRWIDLMPESMVEQLFVGPDEFYMAPQGAAGHYSHWGFPPEFCIPALETPIEDLQYNRVDGKGPKLDGKGNIVLDNGTVIPNPDQYVGRRRRELVVGGGAGGGGDGAAGQGLGSLAGAAAAGSVWGGWSEEERERLRTPVRDGGFGYQEYHNRGGEAGGSGR